MKKAYATPQLTVHGSVEQITLQPQGDAKPCAGGDNFGLAGRSECGGPVSS
jgi:hypothetical protein